MSSENASRSTSTIAEFASGFPGISTRIPFESGFISEVLVERGWLFPQDIAQALAVQFGIEYVDINHISIDLSAAARLSPEIGQRCCAIGVRTLTDGTLLVAVADPTSAAIKEVEAAITGKVAFAVTERADIEHAWQRILSGFKP